MFVYSCFNQNKSVDSQQEGGYIEHMCEYERLPFVSTTFRYTSPINKCKSCGTKHRSQTKIQECESLPDERIRYQVGEKVIVFKPRLDEFNRPYHIVGFVVATELVSPDSELVTSRTRRWPDGNRRAKIHNRIYVVNPDKKAKDGVRFLGPELQRTSERSGMRRNIDLPF